MLLLAHDNIRFLEHVIMSAGFNTISYRICQDKNLPLGLAPARPPEVQARSDRSLLCRDPSLVMNHSAWAPERCIFPFAEWPLGILADIPGAFSYIIGDTSRCRRTNEMEQL
jgi:hypothetical protein